MSRESFIRNGSKHSNITNSHLRSKKQEKEVAKRFKGSVTPGSGNGKHHKGDVRVKGVIRIECKTTKNKSFSVTREMISKIEDAALPNNEIPAIIIEFIDEDGKPQAEVAVLPTYAIEQLTEN